MQDDVKNRLRQEFEAYHERIVKSLEVFKDLKVDQIDTTDLLIHEKLWHAMATGLESICENAKR